MFLFVVAGLAAGGGAVFCVLDRPVAADPRRNARLSVALLAVSALILLGALVYAVTCRLAS